MDQQFFRINDLLKIFNISKPTFYRRLQDGGLPPLQTLCGEVRGYTKSTVEQILQAVDAA